MSIEQARQNVIDKAKAVSDALRSGIPGAAVDISRELDNAVDVLRAAESSPPPAETLDFDAIEARAKAATPGEYTDSDLGIGRDTEIRTLRAALTAMSAEFETLLAKLERLPGEIRAIENPYVLGQAYGFHAGVSAAASLVSAAAEKANAAPHIVEITIEKAPRCHWHSNCKEGLGGSGIMKIVRYEKDRTIFKCLSCDQTGYFPVGGSFGVPFCSPLLPNETNDAAAAGEGSK